MRDCESIVPHSFDLYWAGVVCRRSGEPVSRLPLSHAKELVQDPPGGGQGGDRFLPDKAAHDIKSGRSEASVKYAG